jgi:hypothetical protein
MRRVLQAILAGSLALAAAVSQAAPAASVEGVMMPAWVEGAGQRTPLAPGMALRAGDEIRTGPGSRVYVKLAEGSLVKLGENAALRIVQAAPERRGVFKAAMNVLEGAFRFTTAALTAKRRREIDFTIRTVTAGVRGTDLWGKSLAERQIVCLIEGRVEVAAPGEAPIKMDQPLQFYVREKGAAQPLSFVSPEQLKTWAAETEIEPGRGAARRGGKWQVTLAVAETREAARPVYDGLREAGYAAQMRSTRSGERREHRVRIAGLPTRADADALAARLRGQFGITETRVSR